ncbi:CO/xanthine dehydrogenase FAD-binding subunit [Streptomyces sp. 1114.5]|uniref:FAD binding domain-containing protein n=1 Tax=unclassified Streptomyces TaxID=2593676 RepID=UPI000BD97D62|nr:MULTISPECIES: FAD binding domain-containing protein [unclassified Streptomyces]RKT20046.1 CO/xanthine dehydrogenase FAD-binding subunit [Streptomyces sp. 1114.5]SOB86238.1 CO or xanthine dehydrogenase, FAD-binding subunit [Streptomyces sp. 1331.2]
MDLNTVTELRDARQRGTWRPGDAWLGGGTYLFSEPQPHLRRLIDLSRMGWEPVRLTPAGDLEIAATCTIAQLSRFARGLDRPAAPLFEQCCRAFLASWKIWHMATVGGNLCNGLPAGPMISLTAALDGVCTVLSQTGGVRQVPVEAFVTGAGVKDLRPGDLLRSILLPARALQRRTAFRQASLYGLGRSGALLIGTRDPLDGELVLTVTASTVRPIRLRFPVPPNAEAVREAVAYRIAPEEYYDDIHGHPAWRRHMTFRLAEQLRRELVETPAAIAHRNEATEEDGR